MKLFFALLCTWLERSILALNGSAFSQVGDILESLQKKLAMLVCAFTATSSISCHVTLFDGFVRCHRANINLMLCHLDGSTVGPTSSVWKVINKSTIPVSFR